MIEKKIIEKYDQELQKYGENDRRSIFWTKDKQDNHFNVLLGEEYKMSQMRLLDYGCGFADLNSFLKRNYYTLQYNGCDINSNFVKSAKRNYPNENIFLIESSLDITDTYDIILVSGTFNLLDIEDSSLMKEYVFEQILTLFSKTNHMLTMNFLSHLTDEEYRYPGHFYLDPMELYDFAVKYMTKRVQIDTKSLPYEITVKFYKNEMIDPNSTLYKEFECV